MDISFDLDGTLIPLNQEFPTMPQSFGAKILGVEPIRVGTLELMAELKSMGHSIHIYTTSLRRRAKIRRTFRHKGIRMAKVITQKENLKALSSLNISASKYPPAFGFDVHIDDAAGVGIEGNRLGFRTIIVDPLDSNWTECVLAALSDLG